MWENNPWSLGARSRHQVMNLPPDSKENHELNKTEAGASCFLLNPNLVWAFEVLNHMNTFVILSRLFRWKDGWTVQKIWKIQLKMIRYTIFGIQLLASWHIRMPPECPNTYGSTWAMKKPWLVRLFRGWHPTQLYRDYFINHEIKDP